MNGTVTGVDEFREFARDIRSVDTDAIMRRALRATGRDYVKAITGRIRSSSNPELESDKSKYSPGDPENPTHDGPHIREWRAWNVTVQRDDAVVVTPHPDVRQRAVWLEYGTSAHGPNGDDPMHFFINGAHVVITEESAEIDWENVDGERDEEGYKWGKPGEVSGVDPQMFFRGAANDVERGNRLKKNLEEELEKEISDKLT